MSCLITTIYLCHVLLRPFMSVIKFVCLLGWWIRFLFSDVLVILVSFFLTHHLCIQKLFRPFASSHKISFGEERRTFHYVYRSVCQFTLSMVHWPWCRSTDQAMYWCCRTMRCVASVLPISNGRCLWSVVLSYLHAADASRESGWPKFEQRWTLLNEFERCWTMFSTSLNEFEQNSNEFERVWTNLNCLRPCTAIWFSCVVCFCLGCVTLFSYPNLTYFVCVRNNLHWSFCIKVFDSFSEIFFLYTLRFFSYTLYICV